MGCDGMRWDAMGCDGMRWDAMGCDGMRWDATRCQANLFIGNLEPECDEKMLYDTFSSFGVLLFAKIMRDPDTGASRGFGFISFDTFDASDAALAAMNGQFICNRPISVSYAYKKETKGERHGSAAERLLAANKPAGEA